MKKIWILFFLGMLCLPLWWARADQYDDACRNAGLAASGLSDFTCENLGPNGGDVAMQRVRYHALDKECQKKGPNFFCVRPTEDCLSVTDNNKSGNSYSCTKTPKKPAPGKCCKSYHCRSDGDNFCCRDMNTAIEQRSSVSANQSGLVPDCKLIEPGTITLIKKVNNKFEGKKKPSDFPLFVGSKPVKSGEANKFPPGTYQASETADSDYTAGKWTGDCSSDGTINLTEGASKTCTITNSDVEPPPPPPPPRAKKQAAISFTECCQQIVPEIDAQNEEYTLGHVIQTAINVYECILCLVGALILIMLVAGAFMIMISGGNDARVGKGKQIIAAAVVGGLVVFFSYLIVNFAVKALGAQFVNEEKVYINPQGPGG